VSQQNENVLFGQSRKSDDEPGVTREEVEAEARREPVSSAPPRERKPHPDKSLYLTSCRAWKK
jgi:hypothetical protein